MELSGVKWLESLHEDIIQGDIQSIGDSKREIFEDLVSTIIGRHKGIIQGPLEADLPKE